MTPRLDPRDTVAELRALAQGDGEHTHALYGMARELELWLVTHRAQLDDPTTRATPAALRLIAARLDKAAAALGRPWSSKRAAAAEIRANADHLRRIATPKEPRP